MVERHRIDVVVSSYPGGLFGLTKVERNEDVRLRVG